MPEQYDRLVATQQKTVAASKSKGKAVAMVNNESNYGQSSSEEEQKSEEGELAAQCFQCVQQNKKLASKKVNAAKARDAQQHQAINDFSGRIPDGLGVKVWGPNDVEWLNSCFRGTLGDCMYYSPYSNTVHIRANANWAAAFKHNSHQQAKMPVTIVYKYALRGLLRTPYELEWLYRYYANEHVSHHDRVVMYMLISELLLFAQQLDNSLQDRTMQVLLSDPLYQDLKNPIQGLEDMDLVEQRHISTRFLHIKEDETLALRVMHTPDPAHPFDLEQVVQYTLIFGWPGMENTWQRITFDYAFCMHWQTLFGFALCWALCANSAAKSSVVRRLVLVIAWPRMYREAVALYNAAFLERPLVAQYGSHLNILQVHVPDDQTRNFSDNDTLCILLHNRIPLDWVDHAYTYGVVYLEQQFHNPMMSMDIFKDVDNKHIEHVSRYGTPPTIPQWDGWKEMMEDDYYHLMFKRTEERLLPVPPEATGLYHYIGMDPNRVHLWKRTAAHGMLPSVPTATNIALTELLLVDTMAVSGPSTPPRTKLVPHESATNIAIGDMAMMLESGEGLEGNAGHEP
ncbi:hypothetical protein C0995_008041 [Termitomyces sp. Mi166|nr:hypothetical protein C0995_008041 [Termitomyces sp. Mi166\